jgi:flagellum-specific peptidoglycan hydrolase FlgJ
MTKQEFLNKIIPIIQNENSKRGNPLYNSVVIAQAICETGWGSSSLMIKANAIFGIKATGNWKGKVYNARTKEYYSGNVYNIVDCFRAYNSFEESVADYFNLICNSSRYKKALFTNNPTECITAIKNGGYATSPVYINTIMSIIEIII